jgi:hypothetical protein
MIIILITVVGIIPVAIMAEQKRLANNAVLEKLAEERGFSYTPAKWYRPPQASGDLDGCELIVDTYANSGSVAFGRVRLNSSDLPQDLVLKAEGVKTNLWKALAGSDEEIGDEDFDEQVLVYGDEAEITATLDEETRGVIAEMIENKIKLEKGQLYFEREGYFRTREELEGLIELMSRAAQRLRSSDRPREEKLLENVRSDSDPEVRARNLAMLALYHVDSDELTVALEAVLGSVDEGALIAALSESQALDRQVAAAIALGRSGSADGVPHLREWASTVDKEYDYARRVGHEAVAAIQARVGPVDEGGLSLTEGTTGALSEAEGQGGELSVVEAEERRKKLAAAAKGKTGL